MIDLWATMMLHRPLAHQVAMLLHLIGHHHLHMINLQCETLIVVGSHSHRIPIIDAGSRLIISDNSLTICFLTAPCPVVISRRTFRMDPLCSVHGCSPTSVPPDVYNFLPLSGNFQTSWMWIPIQGALHPGSQELAFQESDLDDQTDWNCSGYVAWIRTSPSNCSSEDRLGKLPTGAPVDVRQ